MAPSAGSGFSASEVRFGKFAVGLATKPNGVLVGVEVAVGSGVMLGNGVNVIVGVSVRMGIGDVVKVAVDAAVSVCTFPVIARSGICVAGIAAGAGSVTKQADAASTVANAIKRGAFALFISQPVNKLDMQHCFLKVTAEKRL